MIDSNNNTIYVNAGSTESFDLQLFTVGMNGSMIPLNLLDKTIYFYVKLREIDRDEEAVFVKSSLPNSGISIVDASLGKFLLEISPSDTAQYLTSRSTKELKYSLRIVYGNINRHIQEGFFIVKPK